MNRLPGMGEQLGKVMEALHVHESKRDTVESKVPEIPVFSENRLARISCWGYRPRRRALLVRIAAKSREPEPAFEVRRVLWAAERIDLHQPSQVFAGFRRASEGNLLPEVRDELFHRCGGVCDISA